MTPASTVAFHTLGCKLNYTETHAISRQFIEAGYEKIGFDQEADYYIINTCSVTQNADKECKSIVNKVKKLNPYSTVVVIGCFAQLQPEYIAGFEGVDLVLGAKEKFQIINHLKGLEEGNTQKFFNHTIDAVEFYIPAYAFGDRTRAFLKVQDGCNYTCTFCTIPLARGKSRSPKIEAVVQEAEQLAQMGAKEIVLTGVNIGDFGFGSSGATKASLENFLALIQKLDEVKQISRFRISSIEPNLLHQEIIDWVAGSQRFVPHFHVPLQSGSNEILKKMKRRYLRELYAEKIFSIKSKMPHACIGVDVIVGFPGEKEEDFQMTYDFLNELPASYFHVFTYSERPNTPAIGFPSPVPIKIRKQRNFELQKLSEKKKNDFYTEHLNTTRPVLFEAEKKEDKMCGYTDNYIKVAIPYQSEVVNKIVPAKLQSFLEGGMIKANLQKKYNSNPV